MAIPRSAVHKLRDDKKFRYNLIKEVYERQRTSTSDSRNGYNENNL